MEIVASTVVRAVGECEENSVSGGRKKMFVYESDGSISSSNADAPA